MIEDKILKNQSAIMSAFFQYLLVVGLSVTLAQAGTRRSEDAPFTSPCGPTEQVSRRVGSCMDEIFAILSGQIEIPKNDNDLLGQCVKFSNTEKCARSAAKDCLHGLHKTAVGAVSSATRRFRLMECKSPESRARYIDPLKCTVKIGTELGNVLNNHTGIMQGIRDLNIEPEQKLMRMCCVLNSMDRELETRFDRHCPKSTSYIMGIVHAMTDDARGTLCVAPKCKGALDKVINHKYRPPQNLIEPLMQILFQLNTN